MRSGFLKLICIVICYGAICSADTISQVSDTTVPVAEMATDSSYEGKGPAVDSSNAVLSPQDPPRSTLQISTEPSGAAVIVNDSVRGLSPLTMSDLDTGTHQLIIKKKGYYLKKAEFRVDSADTYNLQFILQQPGGLTVLSEPPGAVLTIAGKKVGITPYVDSVVRPGEYSVLAELENFEQTISSVEVRSAVSDTLKIELKPTAAYRDKQNAAQMKQLKKQKRMTLFFVTGIFALFSIILGLVENAEK